VIMSTGVADQDNIRKVRALTIQDYVLKPFRTGNPPPICRPIQDDNGQTEITPAFPISSLHYDRMVSASMFG
jgi:hypothetical protein